MACHACRCPVNIYDTRMIDFIWHLRRAELIRSHESDAVILNDLENFLQSQKVSTISKQTRSIFFTDPLFSFRFKSNWLPLAVYDQGTFVISNEERGRVLRYELSSFQGFVFCLSCAALFFVTSSSFEGPLYGLKIGLFAFLWLYGMNMVLAHIRVPRAVRRAIRPHLAGG